MALITMADDKKPEQKKPEAIKGEKQKHRTWGSNANRDPNYKPKHEG